MGEVISVECIDTFDPKVIRVRFKVGAVDYALDFPCELYTGMQAQFGFPDNPCGD